METKVETKSEEIRDNHYARLNDYRNTKEYQEYCRDVGIPFVEKENLPSLLNNRWEINEELYWEFLEMLPPVGYTNGCFFMCERLFDNISAYFSKEGGKYYCEYRRLK